MVDEASERAFADVGEVIAANLHRLRTARRMSLATLAARADVAKATLANLEQGRGIRRSRPCGRWPWGSA